MYYQWSPRGHILKSLALVSKPQVLENCPVLGSRTAPLFELLKFCRSSENYFEDLCFWRSPKKIFKDLFFFWRTLSPVPLVLGLETVCPRKGCPWP